MGLPNKPTGKRLQWAQRCWLTGVVMAERNGAYSDKLIDMQCRTCGISTIVETASKGIHWLMKPG